LLNDVLQDARRGALSADERAHKNEKSSAIRSSLYLARHAVTQQAEILRCDAHYLALLLSKMEMGTTSFQMMKIARRRWCGASTAMTEKQLDSALDLMRRMPPADVSGPRR